MNRINRSECHQRYSINIDSVAPILLSTETLAGIVARAHMGPKDKIWGIFELNILYYDPGRLSKGFLYRFGSISTNVHPKFDTIIFCFIFEHILARFE